MNFTICFCSKRKRLSSSDDCYQSHTTIISAAAVDYCTYQPVATGSCRSNQRCSNSIIHLPKLTSSYLALNACYFINKNHFNNSVIVFIEVHDVAFSLEFVYYRYEYCDTAIIQTRNVSCLFLIFIVIIFTVICIGVSLVLILIVHR